MKAAIDQIIQLTAEEFGVMPQAIRGRNKSEFLSLARQAAMHLCWRHIGFTDRTIAHHFGKRDGPAISWARKTVSSLMETNKAFRKSYQKIESKINL